MIKHFYLPLSGLLILLACAPAIAATDASKPLPDKYQPLTKRSMFSKDGPRQSFSSSRNTDFAPPPRPVPSPLLSGVVKDDDEFVAFLEDPQSGRVTLGRVGQKFSQGTIQQITLDFLMLQLSDGALRRVDVGHTLGGDSYTPPAPAASADPATPGDPNDPLEALRRRRQQELQGGTATAPATRPVDASNPAPAADTPASGDPLEALKKRRQQELEKMSGGTPGGNN